MLKTTSQCLPNPAKWFLLTAPRAPVLAALLSLCCGLPMLAADWPTFRGDNLRSGYVATTIDAESLTDRWTAASVTPPTTAWAKPAKWDAYAGIRGLRAMRNYDSALGIAASEDAVFVASSVDDSVTCRDLATGQEIWQFWTDAPVRISPTVHNGRIYFGSDDGHVYCVEATDGSLIWKYHPPSTGKRILHNGRMISRWPCRTGVLIRQETAYCAFSLFPWDDSYLCAIDLANGQPEGTGKFENKLQGGTLEGSLAANDSILVAPQGRVPPGIFSLDDGRSLGSLEGGGGSFVLLDEGKQVWHGPGNKTGWIVASDLDTRKPTARHAGYNEAVLTDTARLQLADQQVTAINRQDGKTIWKSPIAEARTLIAAGDTVFVGARDRVVALNVGDGQEIWRSPVRGDAHILAIAEDALLVSTDEGVIHCFGPPTDAVPDKEAKAEDSTSDVTEPRPAAPQTRVPLPIYEPRIEGMVGRWVFCAGFGRRSFVRPREDESRRVFDLAGTQHGALLGEANLWHGAGIEALVLDGQTNSVLLAENHADAELPKREITTEAWVRVDQPLAWGGILSAVQDNGNYERGWVLGYNNSKFSFGLKSTGAARMTYLTGTTDFGNDQWQHVVGTYDGTTLKIFVNGKLENSTTAQAGDIDYPPQAFYEIGAYHDKDEYHRLTGMLHEVRLYDRVLDEQTIKKHYDANASAFPQPVQLAAGPYARFVDPHTAEIHWRTAEPSASTLTIAENAGPRAIADPELKTEHCLRVDNLRRHRIYHYTIATGGNGVTPSFELDTTFNFTAYQNGKSDEASEKTTSVAGMTARRLLSQTKTTAGICLVLGVDDGAIIEQLVQQSNLRVIVVDTDKQRIDSVRRKLSQAKIHGHRATVHHVESFDALHFVGDFANFIVSERMLAGDEPVGSVAEVQRLLRPAGGIALLGCAAPVNEKQYTESLQRWHGGRNEPITRDDGVWIRIEREAIAGAGEWSHLYGTADNSAYGGEELAGVRETGALQVQWFGRPGPRAQPDRNGRKPSPLSIGGRLFVQGLHRLVGMDAYNGTILWSLEIPALERFNVPRDCSNWCADDKHVFAAIGGDCWKINAQTGHVESMQPVTPGDRSDWKYDWSYVARHEDLLFGSAVKRGTAYVEYWGKADAGWYDARSGPATFKVCSENLFARDVKTGSQHWTYRGGVIINSTITVADDRVYFVECRHPLVKASSNRRVGMAELWQDQHLVALDAHSGKIDWQRPLDTTDGIVTFYMAHGEGRLAIAASATGEYEVSTFAAATGADLWQQKFGWPQGKGDHGKAMSRPAIANGLLHVRPQVFDLTNGNVMAQMPAGGCGTYALTKHAAIFRSSEISVWNIQSDQLSGWPRLRPGCWLSTIPAGGMLLSPEAGGGCSCGKWIETSLGFKPSETK